ncbi:diaminopimelate epimerase [Cytophagaceae bacterium YF14B1]|uniref:Diaminopimelate epimerase n=1 Tax=Xanthocytophaga flava TaxID=3048013 RepID=A0AAE3QXQ3_9BACT|nr:diaminopimelate epimerase [Xanthocytophaga flavus]MDJ1484674.1 diaminopimelate epimerase [Xanthocytophaga flavus]
MLLHFYKYQGTGNDFVIIDDRKQTFPISQELVAKLCDRRFGIGADGLMLLQNHPEYDFRMVYFNSDGNTSSMCGNGGRCLVRFAHALGIFKETTTFEAVDGLHEASVKDKLVYLKMNDVRYVQHEAGYDFLNTGSPHYVTFMEEVQSMTHDEIVKQGRAIRYNDYFGPKGGTNVNFVEFLPDNSLFVRTYERGVEDETYSCGTGVTACALAANFHQLKSPVQIRTKGGDLQVAFNQVGEQEFTDIYLIGPAEKVFEGMIEI